MPYAAHGVNNNVRKNIIIGTNMNKHENLFLLPPDQSLS